MSDTDYESLFAGVSYWFHQIEVAPGVVTPGVDRSRDKLELWDLPLDLHGKRVLDIGCYEGFFSFECERRGANVVAMDLWAPGANGFALCRDLLGSQVEYVQGSVYDLRPEVFGMFDYVLFVGVLYHLRHPLLALERVRSVCRDRALVETQICDNCFILADGKPSSLAAISEGVAEVPMAQFYPGGELNGDTSNWFAPNRTALEAWLMTSGFIVERVISDGVRACAHVSIGDQVAETPYIFDR